MSCGPLIIDIAGTSLSSEDAELLCHPQVAGIILFSRNYQSSEQLLGLVEEIKALRTEPLLITVDQEGGRVQRFQEEFTRLPSFAQIAAFYQQSPRQGLHYAETCAWVMATELLAHGVDLSFTPVLDLDRQLNTVIGDRSFGSDPEQVINLASAYIQGMRQAGMQAIGKHFPGHGGVEEDSHHALPQDPRDWQHLNEDILPFKSLLAEQALAGIMPAHIVYSSIDAQPAGFSKHWLQQVLRQEWQFKGTVVSDDLSMQGAVAIGDICQRVDGALQAGCDLLLLCNDREAVKRVLAYLDTQIQYDASAHVETLLGHRAFDTQTLQQSERWRQGIGLIAEINEKNKACI